MSELKIGHLIESFVDYQYEKKGIIKSKSLNP
jgi:hypothetical protein